MKSIGTLFEPSYLSNQYPPLHGLRVLAIILVVQTHLIILQEFRNTQAFLWWRISDNLWFGMDLFFIMSGFLIGSILLHTQKKSNGSHSFFIRFYFRRALRTFPLYYVVLTFLTVLAIIQQQPHPNLLYEYLYLTNYTEIFRCIMFWAWSLSIEEHFYLVVPLIILILKFIPTHTHRIGLLCILWSMGLVVRLIIWFSAGQWNTMDFNLQIYFPTHSRFDILFAGILLAYLNKYHADFFRAQLKKRVVRIIFMLIPLAIGCYILIPDQIIHFFFFNEKVPLSIEEIFKVGTLTSIGYIFLILYVLYIDGWLSRMLSHRIFLFLATLGYGVYLIHIPVIIYVVNPVCNLYFQLIPTYPFMLKFSIALFFTLLFSFVGAYILHLIVEKPMLMLRDKLDPVFFKR
jgi:peptidoglycan/LPS O-acetylase OafA/YrhL